MKLVRDVVVVTAAMMVAAGCQFPLFKPAPAASDSPAAQLPAPAPPLPTPGEIARDNLEVVELLGYFQRVSALPQDELRKEYNAVGATFQRDKSELQRLRLVLLLLVPGASFRDDARLASLLEMALPRSGDASSPQRQLAWVLQKLNNERMRQVREEQKRVELLPREDAKRVEELNTQNKKLEGQLADEKRRSDELQKKLDALLTIERDLRSRSPQRRPN
jgi:hypothetical protein